MIQAFPALISVIKENLDIKTDYEAGDVIGLGHVSVSQCMQKPRARESWWGKRLQMLWDKAYSQGRHAGRQEVVTTLVEVLRELHGLKNQHDLAKLCGVNQPIVSNWENGKTAPNRKQLARLLNRQGRFKVETLAEFEPITPYKRAGAKKWRIDRDEEIRDSWKPWLKGKKGIYLFYDSAGHVIYIGKSELNLLSEIENRLGTAISRTIHFQTSAMKKSSVCQGEIARLLSAYAIPNTESIHNVEVLLLRALANDHLNRSLGRFKPREK